MKTLLLMRHAEAENAADDFARPLTAKGIRQAGDAAVFLLKESLTPDRILSSDALRTQQTAAALNLPTFYTRALYLADAKALLNTVFDLDATLNTAMIVAHNPGVTELAGWLDDKAPLFSPATIGVFSCDINDWADLGPESTRLTKVFAA